MHNTQFSNSVLLTQMLFAACVGLGIAWQVLGHGLQPDFFMLWAAHHTSEPYNPRALQAVLNDPGAYFPYAPPFLVLTAPLRVLPSELAYYLWLALSAVAMTASLRRTVAPLILLVPPVFLACSIGQTSLFVAAALYTASTLRDRPLLSGFLLGLAAVIKPQVLILMPVVLLAAREWRIIFSATTTAILLSVVATLFYGFAIWKAWLLSLPAYVAVNDAVWSQRYLALPGLWKAVALALGGLACGWLAWQGRLERAVFTAVAAAMLGSLHTMDYDAAILAPFAAAAGLSAGGWGLPFIAAILLPASQATVLALGVLAAWPTTWVPAFTLRPARPPS